MAAEAITRRVFSSGALLAAVTLPALAQSPPISGALIAHKYSRGGVPPADLVARIAKQNAISDQALSLLRRLPGAAPPPIFQPTMPRVDWRDQKKVTPVEDQGQCGSCWDFAAVSAYESAFFIANNLQVDLSEQMALDCNSFEYGCEGGWPDAVFAYLVGAGEVDVGAYPVRYRLPYPSKGKCQQGLHIQYIADTWGYVGGPGAIVDDSTLKLPSDDILKGAICLFGPIAVGVSSNNWDPYLKLANGVPNPKWIRDYPDGVFYGAPSIPNLTNPTSDQIDHVVVLVGWDNSAGRNGAWIVKNSWGKDWGDAGFMNLAYGTANVGFGAVWIRARALSHTLYDAKSLNALQAINLGLVLQ